MLTFLALFLLSAITKAATVSRPQAIAAYADVLARNATLVPLTTNEATDQPGNNSLWSYHIPNTPLTLYITDVGSPLPYSDIAACLLALSVYITRQITISNPDLPSFSRIVRHGVVETTFTPGPTHPLTWRAASEVIDALESIIANDKWTYASYIAIEETAIGRTGDMAITYYPPSPRLNTTATTNNKTNNQTSTLTLPPRPDAPHIQYIPDSDITLLFAGFGAPLDPHKTLTLLIAAQFFLSYQVRHSGPLAPISQQPEKLKPFEEAGTEFELFPGERMRWVDAMDTLDGVVAFVEQWGFFEWSFEVRWRGYRSLGFGVLRRKGRGRAVGVTRRRVETKG